MHRFSSYSLAVTVSFLSVAACTTSVVQGTGGGGTAGSGAGTSSTGSSTSSGSVSTGDCTTDAQCPGGTCAEITPGGYRICLQPPVEITSCSSPAAPNNQCCTSTDCTNGGKCYSSSSFGQCGGPAMEVYNECLKDQCETDADCLGGGSDVQEICAPAGAFGNPVRSCFPTYCVAGCTAKPGGVCAPVSQPCCSTPGGLACVYPGGCAKDADCGEGNTCEIDITTGTGQCSMGPTGCPV
jgi:hypothetical protein